MSGYLRKRKASWQFSYMYKGNKYNGSASFEEAPTEKRAKELLEDFCNTVRKGAYRDISNYTFEDVALLWIKQVASPSYSPNVIRSYVRNLNNHTIPFFARYRIVDINSLIINDFINELKTKKTLYANRENKPLTNETIKTIYKTFHTIMQWAYTNDLITSNPCDKVKLNLKREVETKKHYYNVEEYHRLLELLEDEPIDKQVAIQLALKTGMRRSELFGLKWEDINLDDKVIACNKTRQKIGNIYAILPTKTISSKRTISIPDSLVELLKKYKNDSEFVLNMDYDCLTAWFRKWLKRKGLPHITFHDLRHTHATLLLAEGIDVKTIQKRLGHSDIHTTLQIYAHSLEQSDKSASRVFDEI